MLLTGRILQRIVQVGVKKAQRCLTIFGKAEVKGVKVLGAYATVTEHDYYIIVEANDYSAVVEFFMPLLATQTGRFAPVLTMDEWLKLAPK